MEALRLLPMNGRRPRQRRAVGLTAALVVAQALMLTVTARPASAATCVPERNDTFGVESVISFRWDPQCSDGNGLFWGTVRDPLCEARSARATFIVYDLLANGTYISIANNNWALEAPNGCGSEATFSKVTRSPGAIGWKLVVATRACNDWGGCSSTQRKQWFG